MGRSRVAWRLAFVAAAALCVSGQAPASAGGRHRAPVVMVVFDELPVVTLLASDDALDAGRFPGFAALARTATWYRYDTAAHDRTTWAVPAILTGRRPEADERPDVCDHRSNLFTFLHRRGYAVHAVEPATSLWPPHPCSRPPPRHEALRLLGSLDRPAVFTRWAHRIRPSRRPAVWFEHTLITHSPWIYYPDGRRFGHALRGFAALDRRGPSSPAGFHDAYLQRLGALRETLQAQYADRLLGALLHRLRREGLFDRALIVVTADHGVAFHPGADRRILTRAKMPEVAGVPLLVKYPGQRTGVVERRHVEAIDLLPTMAGALGMRPPRGVDGRSALGPSVARRDRWVDALTRTFTHLHMRLRAFERRQAAAVRRRVAVLGTGSGDRAYAVWGPRALVGRPVAPLAAGRATGLRARFVRRRPPAPSQTVVPGFILGRIAGPRAAAGHTLVLAVDGRVAAVGRSYHLLGRPGERFALLAPEDAFARGGNDVALYTPARGGPGRLRLLGRLSG